MMETISRRGLLVASSALPLAAAVASAPMPADELRVLAMCATPVETWERLPDNEYERTRLADSDSRPGRIAKQLESRGLVDWHPTPWRRDMDGFWEATDSGLSELRKAGVLS